MASNRGVAYMGPGNVEVQSIDCPKLALGDRKCDHGVILKMGYLVHSSDACILGWVLLVRVA